MANEAAAPRVPLCPATDVVDTTLDDQPLVTRQVVRADLFPAEGGQRRPQLRGPLARPWPCAGLPDATHGCVQQSSGTRDLAEVRARHRGERNRVPGGFRHRPPSSAAPPRRCGCRTSVRLPSSRRRNFSLPYNRADSARRAPRPRREPPTRMRSNHSAALRPPLADGRSRWRGGRGPGGHAHLRGLRPHARPCLGHCRTGFLARRVGQGRGLKTHRRCPRALVGPGLRLAGSGTPFCE